MKNPFKRDIGDSYWHVQVCDITGRWEDVKSDIVPALEKEGVILHTWNARGFTYEGAVSVMEAIHKQLAPSTPYIRGIRRRPQRVYNRKTGDFVLSDILFPANPNSDLKSLDEETKQAQNANMLMKKKSPNKLHPPPTATLNRNDIAELKKLLEDYMG